MIDRNGMYAPKARALANVPPIPSFSTKQRDFHYIPQTAEILEANIKTNKRARQKDDNHR